MRYTVFLIEPRFLNLIAFNNMLTTHNEYQDVSWSLICTTRIYYPVSGSTANSSDEHSRRS